MVVVQAGLTRVVIPKIGTMMAAYLGMGCALMAYIGYGAAPSGWVLYLAMIPGALAGFFMPAMQGIMTNRIDAAQQGELQGLLASANALTSVIGPPLMTQVFAAFSDKDAALQIPGAPFYLAAVLTGISLVVLVSLFRRMLRDEEQG